MICPKCQNIITIEEFSCAKCGLQLPVHTIQERIRAESLAERIYAEMRAEREARIASAQQMRPLTKAPAPAPAPAPSFEEPVFTPPVFDMPTFDEPSFDTPAFDAPAFDTPAFDSPAFDTPAPVQPFTQEAASAPAPVHTMPKRAPYSLDYISDTDDDVIDEEFNNPRRVLTGKKAERAARKAAKAEAKARAKAQKAVAKAAKGRVDRAAIRAEKKAAKEALKAEKRAAKEAAKADREPLMDTGDVSKKRVAIILAAAAVLAVAGSLFLNGIIGGGALRPGLSANPAAAVTYTADAQAETGE